MIEKEKLQSDLQKIANVNIERLVAVTTRHTARLLPFIFDEDGSSYFQSRNDEFVNVIWKCIWLGVCFKKEYLNDKGYLNELRHAISIGRNAMGANTNRATATAADIASTNGRVIQFYEGHMNFSKSVDQAYSSYLRGTMEHVGGDLIKNSINESLKQCFVDDVTRTQKLERIYTMPLWTNATPKEYQHKVKLMKKYFLRKGLQAELDVILKLFNGYSHEEQRSLDWSHFKDNLDDFLTGNPEVYRAGTQYTSEVATKQDYLNREPLAKAVAGWLMDDGNKGRITIGLFGNWGLGKTSFVDLLKKQLKQKQCPKDKSYNLSIRDLLLSWCQVLWLLINKVVRPFCDRPLKIKDVNDSTHYIMAEFNAWKYEHSGNIQAGVAQEVVAGLLSNLNWYQKFWLTIRYGFHRYPLQIVRLALIVSVLINLGFAASDKLTDGQMVLFWGVDLALIAKLLQDQGKKLLAHPLAKEFKTYLRLPDFGEHLGTIPVMQEQVKTLIDLRLEHSKFEWHAGLLRETPLRNQRFLFVVDDLDRCSHEGIVKTFEAIRLVMDLENVVVVIAIDQRIALASLALHYQDISQHHQADPISIARDYLGKVVHLPITLEEPQESDVKIFLEKEWEKIGNKKDLSEGNANVRSGTNNQNNNPPVDGSDLPGNIDEPNSEVKDNPLEAHVVENAGASTITENDEIIDDEPEPKKGLSITQEDLFIGWAQKLSITNPRRLKRLTNAYTLIRHCFPQEDQSSDIEKPYPRLVMLLWLEYVNELSPNERAVLSRVYKLSDKEFLGEDGLSTSIQTRLKSFREYISQEEMNVIYNQVKNFVLPAIEIVEQESEKQNYQAHKGLSW